MSEFESLAQQLINLTKRDWGNENFTSEEISLLAQTLQAAGFGFFEPESFIPETMSYRRQGLYSDEIVIVNQLCPFKLINDKNEDLEFATGWLDQLLRMIFEELQEEKRMEGTINRICFEIHRSQPLAPIQLTSHGDFLVEPTITTNRNYFVDHKNDLQPFGQTIGQHQYCGHEMHRRGATATHDALICPGCYLRVLFPKEIETYGFLRLAMSREI